jgi:RNA polymerase sigma-70 factor (ECF subfamily)
MEPHSPEPRRSEDPRDGDVGRTRSDPDRGAGLAGLAATAEDREHEVDAKALEAERVLIARAQDGDRHAFHQLYEQNVRLVVSFLANRVGAAAAEDLTAETFARAFERIGSFEWRGVPIRAWLLRIAYHQLVAQTRKRSSSEIVSDEVAVEDQRSHEDSVVDHLTTHRALLDAVASLPPAQRTAVELRYLRELSVPETAVVLELSEEAVRALTYRSLRSLRAALSG